MNSTLTVVDQETAPAPEGERTWRERPVSDRAIFRAQDAAGRRGWFFRMEVTGLYPRRVGPFPTRTDALNGLETLLVEIVLGAFLDLRNDLVGTRADVVAEIPTLTGATKGW